MGHLINPIALRLGWFASWADLYFVEFRYYPEFLHSLLRLRLYLFYFFNFKRFEKMGYFCSHFQFVKASLGLNVKIFIYDGRLTMLWADLDDIINVDIRHFKYMKVDMFNWFAEFYFMMLVYFFYEKVFMFNKPSILLVRKLVNCFYSFNDKALLKSMSYKFSDKKGTVSRFYVFYMLFKQLKKELSANYIKNSVSSKTLCNHFFFNSLSLYINLNLFTKIQLFLSYICEQLAPFRPININFLILDNNSVGAKFLSRYIARRFSQRYTLKELLNPLKRELKLVRRDYRSASKYVISKSQAANNRRVSSNFNNQLFKRCFSFLFKHYRQYHISYYNNNGSWFTYEIFILFYWIMKSILREKTHQSWLTKKNIKLYVRSFSIFRTYISRRCYFLFFLNAERSRYYNSEMFSSLLGVGSYYKQVNKWPDFSFFITEMLDDFQANFSTIFGINNFSGDIKSGTYFKAFKISSLQMQRFLNFNYYTFKYTPFYSLLGLNKRNLRLFKPKGYSGLIGFKFHCKGRFTRKQIAASHWFREGKVPLNTLSAVIDYAFYTVPLKNSAISVKIWLYKDSFYKSFYVKLT